MKPPSTDDINRTLREIERTELPEEHPRQIARKVVAQYRQTARLSQQMIDCGSDEEVIDCGSDEEDRRQRFVQSSVKWSKRSLLSRLFRRS